MKRALLTNPLLTNFGIVVFASCLALAQKETAPLSFDAAVVKPAGTDTGHSHVHQNGNLLTMTGVTLKHCIMLAYGVADDHIVGPSWLGSESYNITAKALADGVHDQSMLRLRTLLADRFKLALHRETREGPVYELVVAKNGPKMKKEKPGAADAADAGTSSHGNPNHVNFKAVSMAELAEFLERPRISLDRPVIDKTGLDGVYSFTLDWTPEDGPGASSPGTGARPGVEEWPSIFVAVQEQLGLKLEARKGPVKLLVVDHAEKTPTEN